MLDFFWFGLSIIMASIPLYFLMKAKKVLPLIIFSLLTYSVPILFGFAVEWLLTLYMKLFG